MCVKWRRLGDSALWNSALSALRIHYPNSEIDLLLPPAYHPLFIDDKRFQIAPEKIRERRYNLILNFHASARTSRWCLFSGAKKRVIHFHSRRPRHSFFSMKVPSLGVPMSAIERDLNVIRALGWEGQSPKTELKISALTKKAGEEFLKTKGWSGGTLVLFSPQASRLSKQWSLSRYAELAHKLRNHCQVGVLYERTRPDCEALFRGTLDLCTPSLSLLLGVLPHAQQWIGSDSGVKHLACALNVATLTLFGPESIGEWHGYSDPHQTLQKAVPCRYQDPDPAEFSWCKESVCPLGSHACMNLISVDEVVERLKIP